MHRKYSGYSLIELIVVIAILGLISGVGFQIFGAGLDAYFKEKEIIDADWQGRVTMARLGRELHEVRSANDITVTPATEIQFVHRGGTTIRYWLSGSRLMRNNQPLGDGIVGFTIVYLQADGKSTTTLPSQIYYVVVSFTINKNGVNFPLRTVIHPRNIV